MIEVRLFATFRQGRKKEYHFDSETIKNGIDIINYLNLPQEEIAIYLINGMHKELDDPIQDGDIVAIFPPVGGG